MFMRDFDNIEYRVHRLKPCGVAGELFWHALRYQFCFVVFERFQILGRQELRQAISDSGNAD